MTKKEKIKKACRDMFPKMDVNKNNLKVVTFLKLKRFLKKNLMLILKVINYGRRF